MKRLLITSLFLVGCFTLIFAQTNDEFRELQKKQRDMLLKIEETTQLLAEVENSIESSLQYLKLLNQKVSLRKEYIAGINKEVEEIDREIEGIKNTIETQSGTLEKERQLYAKVVQGMQKNRYFQNKLLFVFSAESLAQSYRRFEYLKQIYNWQKTQLKAIKSKQDELGLKQKGLESKRAEKLALLTTQQKQDIKLFEEEKEQQELIEELKAEKVVLMSELKKQQGQESKLNELIEAVISGSSAAVTSANSGANGSVDQSKTAKKIENSKGKLPMPVPGNYLISGRFGEKQFAELDEKATVNSGVDIQALSGINANAVFDGEVSAIFNSEGYHTSVVIRHGDYVTVYANLADVHVKKGESVLAGQAVGTIYRDSAQGNVATLHFQIRKGKLRLNPEEWLRK